MFVPFDLEFRRNVSAKAVVETAEVPLWIDERNHPREVLAHPGERVVDRGVAMGVVLAHRVADDARRFAIGRVGSDAHLQHRPQDAALDRLEPVAYIGDGP